MKTAIALFSACLVFFVTLPIWFYLLYKVLQATQATDLMWFLYWAYVPASVVAACAGQILKVIGDD